MKRTVLKGRPVAPGVAQGEALVTTEAVSWCGGVDPMTGIVTELGHGLHGQSVKGKVLVFLTGKGSSAFSHAAHVTRIAGCQPAAVIVKEINPQTALGTTVMHIPAVTGLERDPTKYISTGDLVTVDGSSGTVTVIKQPQGKGV
jgi:predicted aconitase with swiveling domain